MRRFADAEVKYAAVTAASSGDNIAVAAVSGKKIRLLACALIAAGAVNASFRDESGPLSGIMDFAAAGEGITLPFTEAGWLETTSGEELNINLSGAVGFRGLLVYVEIG